MTKVIPNERNFGLKAFDKSTGVQLDPSGQLTDINTGLKQDIKALVKIIDEKINNMSTKGVYHPRRYNPSSRGYKMIRKD
ncbi:MAG: hypothetical protein Wins2KO_22330 [Winogradskyella sp.]